MQRDIEFNSNGELCRGWLLTPDQGEGPFPTIVMAGGWCYVKEIVMPEYAKFLLEEGCAVLLFDYRNFGSSEGRIRQHLDPWAQIDDYRNAISFAERLPEVDAERIGVWGISYSGGNALIVGAMDPRVKLVLTVIPVVDGYANMLRSHGELGFAKLRKLLLDDHRKRAADPGHRGHIDSSPGDVKDPPLCAWPYPDGKAIFEHYKNTIAPLREHYSTIESVEMLLNYTVFPYAKRIVNIPTHMSVVENDNLTCWDLEIEAFREIRTTKKELFVVPQTTHMTLYADMSRLAIVGSEQGKFVCKWFAQAPARAAA